MKTLPSSAFITAMTDLASIHQQFADNQISSVEHGNRRDSALAAALTAMAADFGLKLEQSMRIDSRGEYALVVLHPDGRPSNMGSGRYGEEYAEILGRHSPRTGILPARSMSPDNGWCRINHFDAERMVKEYASRTAQ